MKVINVVEVSKINGSQEIIKVSQRKVKEIKVFLQIMKEVLNMFLRRIFYMYLESLGCLICCTLNLLLIREVSQIYKAFNC